jgi:hypothetical protein
MFALKIILKPPIFPEAGEDETVDHIVEEADDIRLKLGLDEITPICILTAIVKPQVAFTLQQLKSLPLREHEIFNLYRKDTPYESSETENFLPYFQTVQTIQTSLFLP